MSKRRAVIRRTDENQPAIVADLNKHGYCVRDLHIIGGGFPDLLVAKFGLMVLVEVKRSWGELLTIDERTFFQTWQGPKIVATCAEEVEDWFSEMSMRLQ